MNNKIKRSNKGITLISLIITIIVMLILTGVSLSMVVGENSILSEAKESAFMQEVTGYKEQLAVSLLGEASKELRVVDKSELTARGDAMKKYIPTITDGDINDYMIIAGELYYVGDDEFEIGVCNKYGLHTKPDNMTKDQFYDSLEVAGIEAIIQKVSGILTITPENGDPENVGIPLATKTAGEGFGSASKWVVISEIQNGKTTATYADGWYYVPEGTEFPNLGKLKYSYIINYTTKEAVRFTDNHAILNSNGGLSVEEGLVFSADPASMDGTKKSWGDAKLNGFEDTVKVGDTVVSGWTKDAFVTDGEDDFVELSKEGLDFKDGYTIECFCKIPNIYANNEQSHVFAKGVDYTTGISVGLWGDKVASTGYKNTFWFGYQGHRSWDVNFDSLNNKDFYIVIKGDKNNPKGDCYVDNQKLTIRTEGSNKWENYLSILNDSSKGFIFGKGTDSTGVDYTKMYLYSIRVYNRNLSEDELTANYNATIAYHDILGNDGNAGNNNTGGESFDDAFGSES